MINKANTIKAVEKKHLENRKFSREGAAISSKIDEKGTRVFNLTVAQEINYDVVLTEEVLAVENKKLTHAIQGYKAFCLVDKNVMEIYKDKFTNYFACHKIEASYFIFEPSEKNKKLETVTRFVAFCFNNKISRRDRIVCFGGGITCDIGGFAANLIRRGTPCIKIPTSLIGIIDAAVGVKTGINFYGRKNSIGTYSPPAHVFCDIGFITTLPERQINNGIVEIIKIIALMDREIWHLLYHHVEDFLKFPYNDNIKKIIDYSILYMMDELKPNLFEKNLRRIVDYGHEFGHPIETITNHELLHGEAVGIGMLISNCIALNQGIMEKDDFEMFIKLYQKMNIPFYHEHISKEKLFENIESIKAHKNGNIDLVIVKKIGTPGFLNTISMEDMDFAVQTLIKYSTEQKSI